jgi:hypothetical protein
MVTLRLEHLPLRLVMAQVIFLSLMEVAKSNLAKMDIIVLANVAALQGT